MGPVMAALRAGARVESLLLRASAGFRPRRGWHRRALCATPGVVVTGWPSNEVCERCPVRLDCLVEALWQEQTPDGVHYQRAVPADVRRVWLAAHPEIVGATITYARVAS